MPVRTWEYRVRVGGDLRGKRQAKHVAAGERRLQSARGSGGRGIRS
jgi:hypothetical protein